MHNLRRALCVGLLLPVLALSACGGGSQGLDPNQVPQAVRTAFASQNPGVTPVWERQPYGYEAVFTQNNQEYEVEYAADGRWLETEYEVAASQFSQQVLERVSREHPGFQVTKHEIEITPQGTFYEVEITQGSTEYELYFDQNGNPARNANEDA
ncbi:MAG: PepSY-like domain-containing protein [Chloroflexaceae bacterium]|nr:PepSY-like domain-containing protein [Chloroflexaceae bacterium]